MSDRGQLVRVLRSLLRGEHRLRERIIAQVRGHIAQVPSSQINSRHFIPPRSLGAAFSGFGGLVLKSLQPFPGNRSSRGKWTGGNPCSSH